MHWVGSDTLDEQSSVALGQSEPWIVEGMHHWAESEWMVREVELLGISCELIPLPSARIPDQPSPLPSNFSVLVYMPDVRRGNLYGLDRILQVARQLPNVPFDLVGLLHGPIVDAPPNLRIHTRIPDLKEFYRKASVVWRPVCHDGLSFMVLEALGHARHVLWNYAFPGVTQVTTAEEAQEEISRLFELHRNSRLQPNWKGAQAIAEGGYLPQTLKGRILNRLEQILECSG